MKLNAKKWVVIALVLCLVSSVGASLFQTDFGKIDYHDMTFVTDSGHELDALLLIPQNDTAENPGGDGNGSTETSGDDASGDGNGENAGEGSSSGSDNDEPADRRYVPIGKAGGYEYDKEFSTFLLEPAGAIVLIDGVSLGAAPVEFEKILGTYTITLKKNGKEKEYTVTVDEGSFEGDVYWKFSMN